jgi:hypothetical protein
MKSATAVKSAAIDEYPAVSQPAAKFQWRWFALICLLLGISGVYRYARDWYFESLNKRSEIPLFPLSDFPKTIGSWQYVEGSEGNLEDDIAKISGASDHVIRTYVDQKSGEQAVVMIIYGLGYIVWNHTPDACYPAVGFKSASPRENIEIKIPGTGNKALFSLQRFLMVKPGQRDLREVYYSFRNAGDWSYDMAKNWKLFRYHPGMFKVQVQRQGTGAAQPGGNEAVDELLGLIVREIEGHVADKGR